MILKPNGIDIFYIDESNDSQLYAVTAVAVPFIRPIESPRWEIQWPRYLDAAKLWRQQIASELKVPTSKELHGTKLISGHGNYLYGNRPFKKPDAAHAYRRILELVTFLPNASVISVVGARDRKGLYGHHRLERSMYALFQRMRSQCVAREVNAMVFFDEGHPEYRSLYRRAKVNLPTGSSRGSWGDSAHQNLPLDMFVKDGNEKSSRVCRFTQLADLIAFAALCKVRSERQLLTQDQESLGLGQLYDHIPTSILNTRASGRGSKDGIVRL